MVKRQTGKLTKSEQMALVRSRDTGPELCLRRALWAAGMRYRLHYRVAGTPDLAFPRPRVAVFVDGCFWHGCPEHYTAPKRNAAFWQAKVHRNVERDRRVDAELKNNDWLPVRIWEHEIRRDLDATVERIKELVLNRAPNVGEPSQ